MGDFEIEREDRRKPLKTGVSCSKRESWNVCGHCKEKPTIKLGEIISVNPNSYKTIREVLFNLLQQVKSDERTRVRIGFDGVPYRIAKELIDKVHFCNGCEEIIDIKEESLESHLLQFHDGDSNVSLKSYFGDILLVPGPGHMEKNFLLTIFKFMKDVFMFKLADKLGFRSSYSDVFRPFGRLVYWFGCPNSSTQRTLFKFPFSSCISTKNMLK